MTSTTLRLLNKLPRPWNVAAGCVLLGLIGAGVVILFNNVRACHYNKARAEYQQKELELQTERNRLIGQIQQRDKEIAALETEKEAFKAMAEQGVRSDAAKAQQIEQIAQKEAQDLNEARKDMDCRARAADTVALLRTAKPPINLDLASVIRKQCG